MSEYQLLHVAGKVLEKSDFYRCSLKGSKKGSYDRGATDNTEIDLTRNGGAELINPVLTNGTSVGIFSLKYNEKSVRIKESAIFGNSRQFGTEL